MSDAIHIGVFGGEAPALDGRILPESRAQTSVDVRPGYGRLEPLKANTPTGDTVASDTQTIHLFNRDANGGNGFWLEWDTAVNVLLSPVADDVHDRIYWTGDGAPKMSVAAILTSGAPYPSNSYLLGIPAPDTAMTAAVDAGADPDALEISVTYAVTYVSAYGEEGPPPSASTTVVDRPDGHGVTLSNIPTAPAGNYNIGTKRIYRSSGGDYLLVAEIAVATTTYNDTTLDQDLGVAMESLGWDAPDADMIGLEQHPAGFMIGYFGNTLCFSEAYLPHAWPTSYRITTKTDITGLAITSNGVIVGTEDHPYLVVGAAPEAMQPVPLDIRQACLSPRAMVDMGEYAIYPSPDGLIAAGGSDAKNLTDGLYTKAQWAALNPSSMHAYRYDGNYLCFHDAGAFMFNPSNGDLTTLSDSADCAQYDAIRDELYLCASGVLSTFDSAATARSATWKSRKHLSRTQAPYSAIKVDADGYPVTVKVYGDGALIKTLSVSSATAKRLPTNTRYRITEIEVSGTQTVHSVDLATTVAGLAT